MPEVTYWNDQAARQALVQKGRAVFAQVAEQWAEQGGVVAIEPYSGACFWGLTLGKANDAAYAHYPDQWLYFARLDDPSADALLPTW